MPGKNYIKVTSILFIISAVISLIFYTISGLLLGYATIDAGNNYGWIFVAVCVLYTIVAVLQLIAGIKGIKGCDSKEAAADLKRWGYILILISGICGLFNLIHCVLNAQPILYGLAGAILGLLLPILYARGASLNQ